jgi:hypothetical protein
MAFRRDGHRPEMISRTIPIRYAAFVKGASSDRTAP